MKEYTGSISVNDYKKAITKLTSTQKNILMSLFEHGPFNDSIEIANILDYANFGAANLHIGTIGKSIANHLDIDIFSLPKYQHTNGDKPSYYLLVHDFTDDKWVIQKNLKKAIEATLPVNIIFQLPKFSVCKAANENSPIQILLAADDSNYSVFSTERGGMVMTAQNKSISKKAKVEILEIPSGNPNNLVECFYLNYESLRERAINELYIKRNDLSIQAQGVLENIEEEIKKENTNENNEYNLTLDEQEQEAFTKEILILQPSKVDLYNELNNRQ